ncbi:MAG: GTP-binding protein [Candidatus Binatota bacterium]|nr:GTP-binding protein [Candidatus Binatota bacterium]
MPRERGRLQLLYFGSAAGEAEWPKWPLPEVAVGGRSNVGKSSLLNALGGSRKLARVSRTPGRTQRLHFFRDARGGLALVDLPGWGFARASRRDREAWGRAVERYLDGRQNLRALLLLLDVRRLPEEDEARIADFAAARGLALVRLATKVDRLGRAERERQLRAMAEASGAPWLPFSAHTGEGRDRLIEALEPFRD